MNYGILLIVKNILTIFGPLLKGLGLNRFIFRYGNKYIAELAFQIEWAREFKKNKHKVQEYWQKYRYLNKIKTVCKIQKNTKILDVGCGISTVLHFIDGEKYGIDPLADVYKKLYKYPKEIHVQKAFGENIPFPDEYFDIVFCSNVIDHVTDPVKTIDEIKRVLKTSGYFVLTVEIFREKVKRNPAHPHCFTKKDIYSLLKSKFKIKFEEESPWIGLKNYTNNCTKFYNKELIIVLQK